MNKELKLMVLTPAGLPNPSLAIAASRAGGLGVLDLEYTRDQQVALNGVQRLARYARNDFGIKVDGVDIKLLAEVTSDLPERLKMVILTYSDPQKLKEEVQALHGKGLAVILETTCLDQARVGEQMEVDGIIAKGHEAGGRVGNETTFILLQRLLKHLSLPIWGQGGIGLHTAAACYAGGVAGAILDTQLALTRESSLPETVKTRIAMMDGSETVCLGDEIPRAETDSMGELNLKEIGREASHRAEREAIQRALLRTHWNRKEAAQLLQVSYKALLSKIKEYRIDKPQHCRTATLLLNCSTATLLFGAGGTMFAFGYVFNRQSFLLLLDLEVKRARRYQNYLSVLSLTLGPLNPSLGENPSISLKTLANLLRDELRESDLVGQAGTNRLLVMLPYADMSGAHKVRERLEQILQDYVFGEKGLAVVIGEVCFPTHATNIDDLFWVAGNNLPWPSP